MGHFCYPGSYFDAEASLRVAVAAARDASHSGVVKTLSLPRLPPLSKKLLKSSAAQQFEYWAMGKLLVRD